MVIITGILFATGYDIFPVFFEDLPFRITDEPWDARFLAWNERDLYDNVYKRSGQTSGFRTTREWYSSIDLVYQTDASGNVFTKAAFLEMQKIENEVMKAEEFSQWCQISSQNGQCTPFISLLRYFDGTFAKLDPVFNDTNFDNIPAVLYAASQNNATNVLFRYFLCQNYRLTETEAVCYITRTLVPFGTPHKDYNDTEEYRAAVNKYSAEKVKPVLDNHFGDVGPFKMYYRSQALWINDVTEQALADSLWVGGSIGFIFILILLLTGSLWISGLAIFSVFASFVTGNLIYNIIYGYQYLGFFHILALFIILGIGADDIFVFYNIWRNSATDEYPSLAHRLSDVYRRSAISMLFTSLTTAVAFCSSAITALLATRSFGLFSATVVVVNYLSVIVYFPTVVIMYHLYFEKTQWPCLLPCRLLRNKCQKDKPNDKLRGYDNPVAKGDPPTTNGMDYHLYNGLNPVYDTKSESQTTWHEMASNISKMQVKRPNLNGKITGPSEHTENGGYKLYSINTNYNQDHRNGPSVNGNAYNHERSNSRNSKSSKDSSRQSSHKFTPNKHHSHHGHLNEFYKSYGKNPESKKHLKEKKKSLVVRFFTNYYFRFVTNRFTRWLVIVPIAGLLGFFIYEASLINVDSDKAVSDSFIRKSSYILNRNIWKLFRFPT